jgi:aminopeptidase N
MAALSALVHNGLPQAQTALDDFYNRYENDDLVLNKWFVVQSCAISDTALETVEMLTQHPKFDIKNPNKLRSVVGAFTMNICAFNASDGSGYEWFANKVAEVDKINPSMAAMLFAKMAKYKHFEENAGLAAKRVLKDLLDAGKLSSISAETVERMLI